MGLTDREETDLIELYKGQRLLYDYKADWYSDKHARARAETEIGKDFGMTATTHPLDMAWLARLAALLGGKTTQANIVIIGLPHCGKSTIMHQLKPRHEPMVNLTPTIPIGCNAEKFQWRSLTFVAFDLGEQLAGFGNPWEDFYRDCHGIIFVFDSSDRVNMAAAKVQLELVLRNPYIVGRDIPLMLFANKADQPAAISSYQCVDFFSLRNCEKHWNVFSTDALTGEGFNEALDWFAHQLRTRRPIPGLLDQR